jgi:antirestriction protein ArdC
MNYQYNHITKEIYQGRNQADLIRAKKANSFKSDAWLTFLQAKYNGLKIKKSSKGVAIFLGYRKFDEKNKDGKIKTVSRPLGFKTVFNLDQTEKLTKEQLMLRKEAKKNFRKVYFRKFN